MNANQTKQRVVLIVRSHVESKSGGKLRVVRLEPSKAGTRLLTSKSSSIPAEEAKPATGTPAATWRRTREIA